MKNLYTNLYKNKKSQKNRIYIVIISGKAGHKKARNSSLSQYSISFDTELILLKI